MAGDPRDYKLDIAGIDAAGVKKPLAPEGRPFLSVQFDCCNVYQRVYRSEDGKRYDGRCPRCGRPVRFGVARDGTTSRVFRAS